MWRTRVDVNTMVGADTDADIGYKTAGGEQNGIRSRWT